MRKQAAPVTKKIPSSEWWIRSAGYLLTMLFGIVIGYWIFKTTSATTSSEKAKKLKPASNTVLFSTDDPSIDSMIAMVEEGNVCEESQAILEKACQEKSDFLVCSKLYVNMPDTPRSRELHRRVVEILKRSCEAGKILDCFKWKVGLLAKKEVLLFPNLYSSSDLYADADGILSDSPTADKDYLDSLSQNINVDDVIKNHCYNGHILDACLTIKIENEEEKTQLLSSFCDEGKYEACRFIDSNKKDIAWRKRWHELACNDGRWSECGWKYYQDESGEEYTSVTESTPKIEAAKKLCTTQGHPAQINACFIVAENSKTNMSQLIQYQELAKEAYLWDVSHENHRRSSIDGFQLRAFDNSIEYQNLCFQSGITPACTRLFYHIDAKIKLKAIASIRKRCKESDEEACIAWAKYVYDDHCRKQKQ